MIALPLRRGESITFTAHGQSFTLKRMQDGDNVLTCAGVDRARFGNDAEMREDIAHVMECGRLPRAATSVY